MLFSLLVGLVPCELREAMPVVGELVAACCADEAAAGSTEDDEGSGDCCDTAACLFAARATVPFPIAQALLTDGFLLVDAPVRFDRPESRAGPPPTPPPIA